MTISALRSSPGAAGAHRARPGGAAGQGRLRRRLRELHVGAQRVQPLHHRGAALGEVGGRGAAQVAVVQEAELDGLLLVLPHHPLGRPGRRARGRCARLRAARGEPHQPRHLGGAEVARAGAQSVSDRVSIRPSRLRAQTANPTSSRNAGTIANR